MIIACPACATKFNVDAAKLSPTGTRVRCANCGHLWLQTPEGPLADTVPAPAPKPAAAPPPPAPPPPAAPAEGVPEAPRAAPQRLVEPKPMPKPPKAFGAEAQEAEADSGRGAPPPPTPKGPQGAPPGFKSTGRKPEGDRFTASAASSAPVVAPTPAPAAEPARPVRAKAKPLSEAVPAPIPPALPEPERKRGGALLVLLLAVLLLVLSLGGAAYVFRKEIVAFWPQSAWAYQQLGLDVEVIEISFKNVTYTRLNEDGVPILEVRGELSNDRAQTVVVPRLRAGLKDSHGQELYHWYFTADAQKLGAHQVTTFSSRLPSPPVEAKDLEVRFVYGNE